MKIFRSGKVFLLAIIVAFIFGLAATMINRFEHEMQSAAPTVISDTGTVITKTTAYMTLGYIRDGSAALFIRDLHLIVASGAKTIKLNICSGGGLAMEAFAIYDTLLDTVQTNNIVLFTYADGVVASAAVPIFLAGDIRYVYPNCLFVIHPINIKGAPLGRLPAGVRKMLKVLTKHYKAILVRNTEMKESMVDKALTGSPDKYYVMTPSQAVMSGLATRMVPVRKIDRAIMEEQGR